MFAEETKDMIMAFRMIFCKDVMVYRVYYVLIITSLIWSNVYVSIPLTINIVGIKEQACYVSKKLGVILYEDM